jgi:chain length determinant protein EpsF
VVEALQLENNPRAKELLAGSGPLAELRERIAVVQQGILSLLPGEGPDSRQLSVKDWMADRLLRELRLKTNRDSRLIRVNYTSPDPEFSAAVSNAFVKAYLDTVVQLKVKPARQTTQWFDEQTKEFKRNLEQAEAKLAKFQQEKGIVASDERLDVETGRLAELSAQLAMAQSLSYESLARRRQLRDFLASGGRGEAPSEVATSPVIQQLKAGVAEREAKLSELSKRVGRNHPQFQAATTELEQLRSQLNQEIRTAARSMITSTGVAPQREGALRGALEQQRGKVLKLKSDRNELAGLMREVENAQRAYTAAAQRYTQTKMESEVDQASASVVDSAVVPVKPSSPNVTLNMTVALALGLAVGLGIALFLETVNRFVRSEQDIVEIIGVPVLAVLSPKTGSRQNVRYLQGPNIRALPGM